MSIERNADSLATENRLRSLGIHVALLVVGAVTFLTYDIDIADDMGKYMSYAVNILGGKGYVDYNGEDLLTRGPLFPTMISFSYWLFGVSPWSAFWPTRIFCVLNPIIVYALGKTLFNQRVGVAAAVLVLTSYAVSFWSYRHMDAVWPFFTLASILYLYKGFQGGRLGCWILSGALAATSFLVKESTLLFFPLPILLLAVVPEFRSRKNVYRVLIWCAVLLAGIAPWLYFIYVQSVSEIAGVGRATTLLGSDFGLVRLVAFYFEGLFDYYNGSPQPTQTYLRGLSSWFSVSGLFLVAWCFALYRSFRARRGALVLVICLLLLSPYMAYAGQFQMREGQLVIVFLLSYLVLAYCLCSVAEWLARKIRTTGTEARRRVAAYSSVVIVSPVVLFQSFTASGEDLGGLAFLQRALTTHYLQRDLDEPRSVTGSINPEVSGAADWLKAIASESRVMGGSFVENRGIFVCSKGDLKLVEFPVIRIKYLVTESYKPAIKWEGRTYPVEDFEFPPAEDLLFLTTYVETATRSPDWSSLYVLYESHLLQKIEESGVEYVFVGPVFNFLIRYFNSSPYFTIVSDRGNGRFRVYRVDPRARHTTHLIRYTRRTSTCMKGMKRKEPASFNFLADCLTRRMGLKRSEVNRLMSGREPEGFEAVRFDRGAAGPTTDSLRK